MSETTVTVLGSLLHAGREYKEGDTLALPDDVALDCAERGLVELADSPSKPRARRRKTADGADEPASS